MKNIATMEKITVNIINGSGNPLPAYETEGSAGMDLRAALDEPVVLAPLQRAMIPTGLRIALPQGYECQIRPRSGLAERVCQMVISRYSRAEWVQVKVLDETERGSGGFGHTGVK